MWLFGDTWALVVGISEYDFDAPLPGATNAATQFAKLLCDLGVTPEQIYLRLSPLPENVTRLPPGVRKGDAKFASMNNLLQRELRGTKGETLCVFWAGHGAADRIARRLYLADSDASGWTFDFDYLLMCLRQYDFAQQLIFIDACANDPHGFGDYKHGWDFRMHHAAASGVKQFAFLAASLGQIAEFAEGNGVYSRELIRLLRANPPPQSVEALQEQLHRYFESLGTSQKPWSYFKADPKGVVDWHPDPSSPRLSSSSNPSSPVRPPFFYGRNEYYGRLINLFSSDPAGATAVILGGGGIGKTTVTTAVATDPAIAKKYQERRWIVYLETAKTEENFIQALVGALQLNKNATIEEVVKALSEGPGLLVLDNLETPLEERKDSPPDSSITITRHIQRIAKVTGIALLASMRGPAPAEFRWTEIELEGLDDEDAKSLFQTHAPSVSLDDPYLQKFIGDLAGNPLAIELVARNVPGADVEGLWQRWLVVGPKLARKSPHSKHRLNSLRKSIELSLLSPMLTSSGQRLFRLLGQSRGGISYEDCNVLLGINTSEAKKQLLDLRLAYDRSARIDTLPPLRRYGLTSYKPSKPDLHRWVKHYLDLERRGEGLLGEHGKSEMDRLKPEIANLAAALTCASATELRNLALNSVLGYGELVRTSGLGSNEPLADLSEACMKADDPRGAAFCLFWSGKIARERSRYAVATEAFERASEAYERAKNPKGKADCVWSMGAIMHECGDYDAAETAYRASLEIHRQFDSALGQAYAHEGLGEIERARANFDAAIKEYDRGRALYASIPNTRGIANCILGRGHVEATQLHFDEALKCYDEAYVLYTRSAGPWGRANCHKLRGDIARCQGNLAMARQEYDRARLLYLEVGDLWGRATCITAIGDLDRDAGAREDSAQRYREALNIFTSIDNKYHAELVRRKLDE